MIQNEFYLPDESITFFFENSNFLDRSEGRERLLHQLLRETVCNASTVNSTVSWTALIVNFIKR